MIPSNISRKMIVQALAEIDIEGIPKGRSLTKYSLVHDGKLYPPKYVISVSNKIANGFILPPNQFSGGDETNNYLAARGFTITGPGQKLRTGDITIATVLAKTSGKADDDDFQMVFIKQAIESIAHLRVDVILFHAGFYCGSEKPSVYYPEITEKISRLLNEMDSDAVICLGVDGRDGDDQIALAINRKGIVAAARKFHPTEAETDYIIKADSYLDEEDGYPRLFRIGSRNIYLAVCYDIFGIRHRKLLNPGADIILNLIHGFYPHGEGGSGDVYFAKHGLAGGSKQWGCPVFAAASFCDRNVPKNWPSGVLWDCGTMKTAEWSYKYNPMKPSETIEIEGQSGKGIIRIFNT